MCTVAGSLDHCLPSRPLALVSVHRLPLPQVFLHVLFPLDAWVLGPRGDTTEEDLEEGFG